MIFSGRRGATATASRHAYGGVARCRFAASSPTLSPRRVHRIDSRGPSRDVEHVVACISPFELGVHASRSTELPNLSEPGKDSHSRRSQAPASAAS